MSENSATDRSQEQAESFQRVWMDTMTKMMQAAYTVTPGSPPPEAFRHIRAGTFQALSESWDRFLRSPQFLEAMKQWMDQAIAARKMSNELLGRARHEMQAPSREDIDTIMLTVRHMEKRLLDRVEQLSAQLGNAKQATAGARKPGVPRQKRASRPARASGAAKE